MKNAEYQPRFAHHDSLFVIKQRHLMRLRFAEMEKRMQKERESREVRFDKTEELRSFQSTTPA